MNSTKRAKLNKILIIIAIVLVVIAIVSSIVYMCFFSKKETENYEDSVTAKHHFIEMTINLGTKEVERDGNSTTLKEEFGVPEEQQNLILSSETDLLNYFADSTFSVEMKDGVAHIKNDFQTKKLIVEVNRLSGKFNAEQVEEVGENIYILTYDTQKRAKSAFEYLSTLDWIKKVETDRYYIIDTINDESQTLYGEPEEKAESDFKAYGVKEMGFENFQNIIQENGNPSDITIATIGYGACIDNAYFTGRISENYYNFVEDSKEIQETIPQGSRILEVLQESTPHNVKLMPLVVVDAENYTSTVSIMKAILYAVQNSDVICYELVNDENYMISLMLKNAFKENTPVCCVTTSSVDKDKNYPANNSTTIAVSSIDKSSSITNYSAQGSYIDFSAYSTDVQEIFDTSSSVSKWSGAQYSNAHIVSAIALIKTYQKNATILEVYNMLRNYCKDLGDEGKDDVYGYGCPDFSKITIADLDKNAPEIQDIIYDNEKWEKGKNIQIKAADAIRVYGWTITKSDKEPSKWNSLETLSSTLDVSSTVDKNGKYYIWVKDSANNTSVKDIEVNKVDNTAPEIKYTIDDSTLQNEKYVTIKIEAKDNDSGLNETAYSWDGKNWGAENKELKVVENGRYKIYVRDALENVSQKEIKITKFAQEGVATIEGGNIIKSITVSSSWSGNTNNSVRITFNDNLNIVGWKITQTDMPPTTFNNISNEQNNRVEADSNTIQNTTVGETNTTNTITANAEDEVQGYSNLTVTVSLKTNTQYYAWIKDSDGNITSQAFTVSKVEI